jgi:hypothetical protein
MNQLNVYAGELKVRPPPGGSSEPGSSRDQKQLSLEVIERELARITGAR